MKERSNIITSDDILGKDVIDTDGQVLGIAQQLRIDKRTKRILGLIVDQGFMKADLFIGLDFIQNFGVDSVFLNTTPKPKLKGLRVYGRYGKKIGTIIKVEEENNELNAIQVKSLPLGKCYQIPGKEIMTIGYSVILKKGFEDTPKKLLNVKG